MAIQDYAGGIDALSGPSIVTALRLITSGFVWYLNNSVTSLDAASPQGRESEYPLATLAQAHTNAAAGDFIVVGEGHSENLAATQTFNKTGIVLAFAGTGTSRGRFTRAADTTLFDITAAGVQIYNAWLPASTVAVAVANPKIKVGAASVYLAEDCLLEQGANDASPGIQLNAGANNFELNACTVKSTGTAVTARPRQALLVNAAISDLRLIDITIDGGTVGWSRPHALEYGAAVTRHTVRNPRFIGGSDYVFPTACPGFMTPAVGSGSRRGEWTP
jgi:hypothetical protein